MAFNVILTQSGRSFQVETGETILAAGLRQNMPLPYGCRNGTCGTCKGTIVHGQIEQGRHAASALPEGDRSRGLALLCCSTPRADLEIDVCEVAGIDGLQVKKLPCRVLTLERRADDVIVLKLQLPANERLQYLAGQYIEFILNDGARRSYSMAGAPHEDGPIELHIRHMPGGKFTDHVFGEMKERDILCFQGPMGTFFLREDSDKPIVLLASGTGFAPIKAIVEHARYLNSTRPMTLYWGARRRKDLYLAGLAEQWAREIPGFRFVPVLSEPDAGDAWTGRTGFVHRAVIEDLPDLSGHQVYACGAPAMVDSAQCDFTAHHGLPDVEFYADSFTTAATLG